MPRPNVRIALATIALAGCQTNLDPEHGPARLLVRNKLTAAVTSAYILQCAENGTALVDSLSPRENIEPAAERTFHLSSGGCYDALFVKESSVQNADSSTSIKVDTLGKRAHMLIEPHDIYIVTLIP